MCETQTLADVICDFNETFKTEENFTIPWEQSLTEDKDKCGNKTEEPFKDKDQHEQHVQQCTPEKGLKVCEKRGEDAV